MQTINVVGGQGGGGDRDKKGREAGFPRLHEAGEKGKNRKNGKMQRGGSQQIQGGNRD